jgi:hypothetical protein
MTTSSILGEKSVASTYPIKSLVIYMRVKKLWKERGEGRERGRGREVRVRGEEGEGE